MLEWKIGDCQDLMNEMEPDSVDLITTDPPYGYSFMGKDWDKVVPTTDLWQEALRVLKPGAFAFIMSAPRQDVLAHNLVNLSDAGFETGFTSIYWTYSSGFPKAGNIGKMVDKQSGAEREVIGYEDTRSKYDSCNRTSNRLNIEGSTPLGKPTHNPAVTTPTTPQAKALDGSYSGFQPKPAVEVIMCVMKPLSESTYVDQALANQKGITWLDDGRIPYQSDSDKGDVNRFKGVPMLPPKKGFNQNKVIIDVEVGQSGGRFPANLLVSDDALNDGTTTQSKRSLMGSGIKNIRKANVYGTYQDIQSIRGHDDSGSFSRYFDLDAWFDTKYLPKEVQRTFPFLITPKASKSEKSGATHPTVKPVKLFSWLTTIGSRKGDLVLDPFLGSGTTLEAGYFVGRDILGFEIDPQWEKLYAARAHIHQGSLEEWF